jgi:energy-coupling factor transporter ATP-binding protein EcfA2
MYIQKVTIENIRSINHFEMTFPKPAGWHVLIGDNGSGKSSILRAIASVLIGPKQSAATWQKWDEWISISSNKGFCSLDIFRDESCDGEKQKLLTKISHFRMQLNRKADTPELQHFYPDYKTDNVIWGDTNGWFSAGFGPFRRLTGGDPKLNDVRTSNPLAGAHLSLFREDVDYSNALIWLRDLDRRRLKEKESNAQNGVNEDSAQYNSKSEILLQNIKEFINSSELLPHNTLFESIDIDGDLVFTDSHGVQLKIYQLSDGFRSILSLAFELIRQLIGTYGQEEVFKSFEKTKTIDVPGVVLIDEIDAHLHPTWQTRIGQWFTQYFPNIQFIVTTHSPLVCRACEKGSIWRLAAPGSDMKSEEITGTDKQKLINGNILDAYGTEVFGSNVVRSAKSDVMLTRLGELNIKSALGKTTETENEERLNLQQILSTDAPTGF